jgi:hypothetical protein
LEKSISRRRSLATCARRAAASTPRASSSPRSRAPKADCDDELTRIAPLFLRHFNIAAEPAVPAEGEANRHDDAAAEEASAA